MGLHRARGSSASGRRQARGPRRAAQRPQRAAPRARAGVQPARRRRQWPDRCSQLGALVDVSGNVGRAPRAAL